MTYRFDQGSPICLVPPPRQASDGGNVNKALQSLPNLPRDAVETDLVVASLGEAKSKRKCTRP